MRSRFKRTDGKESGQKFRFDNSKADYNIVLLSGLPENDGEQAFGKKGPPLLW